MQAILERIEYPASAKRDSVEGRVVVKVGIDERGIVRDCQVVRGVRKDLDSVAVIAVRSVKFIPAMRQEKPVATTVMIPIAFRLK